MDKLDLPGKVVDYHSYRMHEFEVDGRACKVVEPTEPLPGRRWIWKAEYFEAFPSFELEMLKRGYYLAFMQIEYECGSPRSLAHWDVFYRELTEKYGFAKRPILFGLSVGGLYIYNWAANNTDKVGCIYADNPVCDFKSWPGAKGASMGNPDYWDSMMDAYDFSDEADALAWPHNPVDNLAPLVAAKIPLIHAAATDDTTVPIAENTDILERNCRLLGGDIQVFRHPGEHHPHHGVEDLPALCDTIEKAAIQ